MNRFVVRAAWLAVTLSACVSDPIDIAGQRGTPVAALEDPLEATEREHCTVSNLEASYVDDDSAERGRIRVSFEGASGGGRVSVEVQGAAPAEVRFEESGTLLTPAFVQEASEVIDGQIAVNVHLSLDCGAELERSFLFDDPVKRCGVPALDDIPEHEAEFYACAERWVSGGAGCGESGYLLGYGARYAHAFYFDTRPRMTRRGKEWLDKVLVCLQTELREAITLETSCEDIRRTAFDQHPRCYAESGFCTLPLRDILQVPATVDGKDLLSRDGLRQLAGIVPACGEQFRLGFDRLFRGR